jgi:glycosyltransferase involved in cell wall biosynthesis
VNILLTSHRFYPDIGGIETITEILARHFIAAGHAVRLVTQSLAEESLDRQFPYTVLRRPSARLLLASFRWADIVLQNNLEVRQLWPLLLCRRPLVIGLQTWIRTSAGERGVLPQLKQMVLGAADQLVACSNAIRIDCSPRANVIGNPYNSSLFRVVCPQMRRPAIAFLGRLVSDKGGDLLLNAFAALSPCDWRLSIIGEGPDRGALERLSSDLGISHCTDFYGPLRGEFLVQVLNQHEILVVPSRWCEPFGVVVLEGQACGCVVLASDGGGLPDAVGEAGLLFRRGDQADLTKKLHLLMADSQLRARLRAQAPRHLANFKEDLVGAYYLRLLKRLHQEHIS